MEKNSITKQYVHQSSVDLTNQHATKIMTCWEHSILTMSPDPFFFHHKDKWKIAVWQCKTIYKAQSHCLMHTFTGMHEMYHPWQWPLHLMISLQWKWSAMWNSCFSITRAVKLLYKVCNLLKRVSKHLNCMGIFVYCHLT